MERRGGDGSVEGFWVGQKRNSAKKKKKKRKMTEIEKRKMTEIGREAEGQRDRCMKPFIYEMGL